jgi:hypothetical protein
MVERGPKPSAAMMQPAAMTMGIDCGRRCLGSVGAAAMSVLLADVQPVHDGPGLGLATTIRDGALFPGRKPY